MNWLLPGFFGGAALIGLPVLLHFLRSKPKTIVRFPSLRFLGESAIRDTRKHRIRRWLTLALRCLVIGLLAAAFARPFWVNASAARHGAMIVAIDNSMSMQAAGRWDSLKMWASRQLDELEAGDQAALLVMHPSPAWLLPMTDNLEQVRRALWRAAPGFEKTHYDPALRLAANTLAAHPAGTKTLVWMADEQQLGWTGADLTQGLPAGVKVRFAAAASAPLRQAALVSLRPSAGAREGLTVVVRQFSPARDQRQITVTSISAGRPMLAQQTIPLHAGDNEITLPFQWPAQADGVRVKLDADDLPADDTAWLAAKSSAGERVMLDSVTEGDFLAHALLSTQKLGETGLKADTVPDGAWPVEAVAIVRSAATFRPPRLEQLDRFVDAGGPLWIFGDGSPEQVAWLKRRGIDLTARLPAEEAWHLRDWDPEHPALAAFARQSLLPLLNVEFNQGYDLAGEALTSIANWPDGRTALAEWTGDGHRVLLAGFALDRVSTDWPARASFVPFVHQAVRWLGSYTRARADWRVGDSIALSGTGTWRALDAAAPAPARSVSGSVRPESPGLYEFSTPGARQIFAVNIPPEESDLAPWPNPTQLNALESGGTAAVREQAARVLPPGDEAAEDQQRLWWWALALCGAAILGELALSNRTAM